MDSRCGQRERACWQKKWKQVYPARYSSIKFKLEVDYLLGESHRSLVMSFEGNDGNWRPEGGEWTPSKWPASLFVTLDIVTLRRGGQVSVPLMTFLWKRVSGSRGCSHWPPVSKDEQNHRVHERPEANHMASDTNETLKAVSERLEFQSKTHPGVNLCLSHN